ncbi:hypothetical protein GCM10010171_38770 [Actinokineospora fastidiosa]|uniref:Uncharacterized protein n=1 Tax=Actinokineospora fastidiosa TaxID=1816 RepID=A0A918LF67_9PSEU|nr:hypothetical protein GCM10010171_38770 [Actinokineospora fastidiosa]
MIFDERERGVIVIIDCDRCVARVEDACGDCVVSVLLGVPPSVEFDQAERAAIAALAAAGMIPRLRLALVEKSA